ncbi:hypothetical protein BB347_17435 (plasmid) [Natronorubrum daqingense]|nr:hypothetical protein BB347_17435 [Natronorubrum daqingense]
MDRILESDHERSIKQAFRTALSQPTPEITDVTTIEFDDEMDLLDVERMALERFEDNSIHFGVVIPHPEDVALLTDEVECCPHEHRAMEGELSTLAELGDSYADLERDLIELTALMCDLPETPREMQKYVFDERLSFDNLYCIGGRLTFTFGVMVSSIVIQLYQDYEHEIGQRVGIPIDPSTDELVGSQ